MKKFLSLFLSIAMILTISPQSIVNASAAFENESEVCEQWITQELVALAVLGAAALSTNINDSSVFIVQQTDYSCTLAAAVMMLRRRAILDGVSDWRSITENSVRPHAWVRNEGLKGGFTYRGMHVRAVRFNAGDRGSQLRNLLSNRPEGIVVWHAPTSQSWPHAVLITDYQSGTFFAADSARNAPRGRIPLNSTVMRGSGQAEKLANLHQYWYISGRGQADTTITTSFSPVNSGSVQWVSGTPTGAPGRNVRLQANPANGWRFVGWYIDGSRISTNNPQNFHTLENRRIEARFVQEHGERVTIHFNANGGTGAPPSHTVNRAANGNVTIAFPNTRPTRQGHTFAGWRRNNNQAEHLWQPGNSFAASTPGAAFTFYAQWTPSSTAGVVTGGVGGGIIANQTTITTSVSPANSGSIQVVSGTLTGAPGRNVRLQANPASGWRFAGWYVNDVWTSTHNPQDWHTREDRRIEARFVQEHGERVTIHFNANGGTGAPASHTVNRAANGNVTIAFPNTRPTRQGHTFAGWRRNNNQGERLWQAGNSFNATTPGTAFTFYAQWAPIPQPPNNQTTPNASDQNSILFLTFGNAYGSEPIIQRNAQGVIIRVIYNDSNGRLVGRSEFSGSGNSLRRTDFWYENGVQTHFVINRVENGRIVGDFFWPDGRPMN